MSKLLAALDDYLTIRRALGFKLKLAGWVLGKFVEYADGVGAEVVTADLAIAWARLPDQRSPVWWQYRLDALRGFAKHLQVLDPRTEVPPADVFPRVHRRAKPYIYADDEVARLMSAAGNLAPAFRGLTYQTLIGLLSASGMRLGEAIRLGREDVDWDDAILTIELTKFGKSRQVPVHPTTTAALKRYADERERSCPRPHASEYFFVSMRGTQLLGPNVDRTFHELVKETGLRSPWPRCRPRLHDLRHTFAVRTVRDWYAAGLDVQAMLPRLSTYLGHVNPANTYWYLSAEPELLALAASRLERMEEVAV